MIYFINFTARVITLKFHASLSTAYNIKLIALLFKFCKQQLKMNRCISKLINNKRETQAYFILCSLNRRVLMIGPRQNFIAAACKIIN